MLQALLHMLPVCVAGQDPTEYHHTVLLVFES